jgi:16S rRNA (adenine1518-N6/adenine1519-N6)-dimethyltransferase
VRHDPQESIRATLKRLRIRPNHALGQHFLIDDLTFSAIIDGSGVGADDNVIEIGTGIGSLTIRLAEVAKKVVTVETDRKLLQSLPNLLQPYHNVHLVPGDILAIPFLELAKLFDAPRFHVVANLPYNITAKTIEKIVNDSPTPQSATIMIQREVANRITAKPGDMSMIALATQWKARVKKLFDVPPTAFYPPPEVHSSVVNIVPLSVAPSNLPQGCAIDDILRFAKTAFAHKRKKITTTIAATYRMQVSDVVDMARKAGISDMARPQDLSSEQWTAFFSLFSKRKG